MQKIETQNTKKILEMKKREQSFSSSSPLREFIFEVEKVELEARKAKA